MDWSAIGKRIRQQREYMGLTREQFAEQIDVTPKFCSDIEGYVCSHPLPDLQGTSAIHRLYSLWQDRTGSPGFRYDGLGKLFKA